MATGRTHQGASISGSALRSTCALNPGGNGPFSSRILGAPIGYPVIEVVKKLAIGDARTPFRSHQTQRAGKYASWGLDNNNITTALRLRVSVSLRSTLSKLMGAGWSIPSPFLLNSS